ncbi:hypothetical protein ACH5RR_007237 [Cinchona calisaya]|uniref:Uncharacterized protein n=1 Tax=Cinchona calisaya TaxID=153742 RepID=A0ABD3AR91_9GENT
MGDGLDSDLVPSRSRGGWSNRVAKTCDWRADLATCASKSMARDELRRYHRDNPLVSNADIEVGKNVKEDIPEAYMDTPGKVDMGASISADDVIRAGGFGARDDIGSFLPVASDFTDFEDSLLDARDHEEPQEKISRPGLGWTESEK